MLRTFPLFLFLIITQTTVAQKNNIYIDSIKAFQKNYVATHEVVKKNDKKYFRFFAVDANYNVTTHFEKLIDSIGFAMKTSANTLQHYFKYGVLSFNLFNKNYRLFVYQSKELMKTEKFKDYLFVPFTDSTTGDETYGSGRYLEFYISDIHNQTLHVDFNKAYNPYCAYTTGYHCPIPPKENFLPVAIKAGEMNFGKGH